MSQPAVGKARRQLGQYQTRRLQATGFHYTQPSDTTCSTTSASQILVNLNLPGILTSGIFGVKAGQAWPIRPTLTGASEHTDHKPSWTASISAVISQAVVDAIILFSIATHAHCLPKRDL